MWRAGSEGSRYHLKHSKHLDLDQAFARRPAHSHQHNSYHGSPPQHSCLHAAQVRSCSCLQVVQQAAALISKCLPITLNARELLHLVCKLPLLVKKTRHCLKALLFPVLHTQHCTCTVEKIKSENTSQGHTGTESLALNP